MSCEFGARVGLFLALPPFIAAEQKKRLLSYFYSTADCVGVFKGATDMIWYQEEAQVLQQTQVSLGSLMSDLTFSQQSAVKTNCEWL